MVIFIKTEKKKKNNNVKVCVCSPDGVETAAGAIVDTQGAGVAVAEALGLAGRYVPGSADEGVDDEVDRHHVDDALRLADYASYGAPTDFH